MPVTLVTDVTVREEYVDRAAIPPSVDVGSPVVVLISPREVFSWLLLLEGGVSLGTVVSGPELVDVPESPATEIGTEPSVG